MRQLATLPSADAAQTLADYLLTLHVQTKVEQQPEGWIIWVHEEDQLPRARQELDDFTRNPHDARYKAASQEANALRRQQTQVEKTYHRQQERLQRRMGTASSAGKCTIGLIVASVVVSLLSNGGHSNFWVQALSIAPYQQYIHVRLDPSRQVAEEDDDSIVFTRSKEGLKPILHGQIWRLVTPIFLHFGIWHLLFNMFWLYALGGAIERQRGRLRYVILVVVLAVLSNLTQYFLGHVVWDGTIPHPIPQPAFGGMSGVVYGLFGYVWMKARFQPELGLSIEPANIIILMVCFFLSMTPVIHYLIGSGVANGAHAGGLIAGILIGYVPTMWQSFPSE